MVLGDGIATRLPQQHFAPLPVEAPLIVYRIKSMEYGVPSRPQAACASLVRRMKDVERIYCACALCAPDLRIADLYRTLKSSTMHLPYDIYVSVGRIGQGLLHNLSE